MVTYRDSQLNTNIDNNASGQKAIAIGYEFSLLTTKLFDISIRIERTSNVEFYRVEASFRFHVFKIIADIKCDKCGRRWHGPILQMANRRFVPLDKTTVQICCETSLTAHRFYPSDPFDFDEIDVM